MGLCLCEIGRKRLSSPPITWHSGKEKWKRQEAVSPTQLVSVPSCVYIFIFPHSRVKLHLSETFFATWKSAYWRHSRLFGPFHTEHGDILVLLLEGDSVSLTMWYDDQDFYVSENRGRDRGGPRNIYLLTLKSRSIPYRARTSSGKGLKGPICQIQGLLITKRKERSLWRDGMFLTVVGDWFWPNQIKRWYGTFQGKFFLSCWVPEL